MAQHLIELCSILVEEAFGDAAALIWTRLADHGRAHFPQLTSLVKLTPNRISTILAILVNHRCIVHFTDVEFEQTYYSVNLDGTYNLLRLSRLGKIVRERCGDDAATVITNMGQLGHMTVECLELEFGLEEKDPSCHADNTTHVNGINGMKGIEANGKQEDDRRDPHPIKTFEQLHSALTTLIRAGFLIKAQPKFFETDYDHQEALETHVQQEQFMDGKITGPRAADNFRKAVNDLKRKRTGNDFVYDGILDRHEGPTYGGGPPAKKHKPNGHLSNGVRRNRLDKDVVLYINMQQYLIAARSQQLVKMAKRHLGDSSASVYKSFLRTIEKKLHNITDGHSSKIEDEEADNSDDEDDGDELPYATAADVYDVLDADIDFTTSIKLDSKDLPTAMPNGDKISGTVEVQQDFSAIGIKQEQDSDGEQDARVTKFQNRARFFDLIEKHLGSLEENPRRFCGKQGRSKPINWSIDFQALVQTMIRAEIDESIAARYDRSAVRIVRILRDKGKLDEKQISDTASIQIDDCRDILCNLFAAGFVEWQEIAKDSARSPNKAVYLWYVNDAKVQRMIVHQCYHAMARALQRLAHERERYKTVINKAFDRAADEFFGDNYYRYRTEKAEGNYDDDDAVPDNTGQGEFSDEAVRATAIADADAAEVDDAAIETHADDAGLDTAAESAAVEAHKDEVSLNARSDDPDTATASSATAQATAKTNDSHSAGGPAVPEDYDSKDLLDLPVRYVLGETGLWKTASMARVEKQYIKEWRALEATFTAQIMRLDDILLLFRDFNGQFEHQTV